MLYTEWLGRVRSGADDKIWTFGFVYHPNYTDRYLNDLSEFLDWLDRYFIGKTTAEGYTIARYATIGEIAQEFLDWETAHPGASSFSYVRGDARHWVPCGIVQVEVEVVPVAESAQGVIERPGLLRNGIDEYDMGIQIEHYSIPDNAGERTVVECEDRILSVEAAPYPVVKSAVLKDRIRI